MLHSSQVVGAVSARRWAVDSRSRRQRFFNVNLLPGAWNVRDYSLIQWTTVQSMGIDQFARGLREKT